MFTLKNPKLAIKILSLLLVAAVSFFIVTDTISEAEFVEESLQAVEENSSTVMKLSAATLSASLAISAFPDDFATPIAQSLSDMNVYFVFLLTVLFLEKILLKSGIQLAFGIMIPIACIIGAVSVGIRKGVLKSLAVKLLILALTIAFVVPLNLYATKLVAAEILTYVDDTIVETTEDTNKINEAVGNGDEEETIFEKLSELFHTVVNGVSDLMTHMKNTVRKCMNSIAILIVSNFVMPMCTFFALKWVLKETFNLVIPSAPISRHKRKTDKCDLDEVVEEDFAVAGEDR